jgi:hypothetical protein
MLDAVGPDRVIAKIRGEGGEVPAMLRVLVDSGSPTFYRAGIDGQREHLGCDGTWSSTPTTS